jgi:hypothetical protein
MALIFLNINSGLLFYRISLNIFDSLNAYFYKCVLYKKADMHFKQEEYIICASKQEAQLFAPLLVISYKYLAKMAPARFLYSKLVFF